MLMMSDYIFYFLAIATFMAATSVVLSENPIYSALFLAATMIGIAGLFVSLDALFIAAVQLIVYAGAVMVLFVMVIMLFDLKHEPYAFSRGTISNFLKLLSAGMILGAIAGSVYMSAESVISTEAVGSMAGTSSKIDQTRMLAETLFTKYLFGFEVIGFLLLMIAVGAVALSRIEGGTHAD